MSNTTDNVFVTTGTSAAGAEVATDYVNVGGVTSHYQYMKLAFGNDGAVTYVSKTSGKHLPVELFSGGSALGVQGTALKTYLDESGITLNVSVNAQGLTAIAVEGYSTSTTPLMVSGTTAIGGAVGVTGNVAVSGSVTSTVSGGVTVGGFTQAINPLLVSGTTAIGGAIGVTGNVAVSGAVTSTVSGGVTVGGFPEATVPLLVSGTTAIGGAIGVTGNVAVSASDLDIRGLSYGSLGSTLAQTATTDSVVVQGVSGAFPVSTLIRGYSAGNDLGTEIGASGDALKVAVVDAAISATVNVGSEIAVKSNNTHLQVSGSSAGDSHTHPVIVAGKAGFTAIGVTMASAVAVTGTVAVSSATVTATDLDIRGITLGAVGSTLAPAATTDSIIVQGVSGGFPVGNVLHGMSTAAGGDPIALSTVFNGNVPTLQVDLLSATGITNTAAIQIHGRNDGATTQPVYIAGVGATSASGGVSTIEGLIGVTFDISNGLPVIGGATAAIGSSLKSVETLMHGLSGTLVRPVGMSGDAFNVNVVGAAISATISDTDLTISSGTVEVSGGTLERVNITGGTLDDVTITGGTVGITYEHLHEIEGLSGGISNIYAGVTGICGSVDSLTTAITISNDNFGTVQGAITSVDEALGILTDAANGILNNSIGAISDSPAPTKRVFVESTPPTSIITETINANTPQDGTSFTSANILRSGARIKLHPLASDIVFINGSVNSGYPLSAGDEIFIETSNLSTINVSSAGGGTNMIVFALGF